MDEEEEIDWRSIIGFTTLFILIIFIYINSRKQKGSRKELNIHKKPLLKRDNEDSSSLSDIQSASEEDFQAYKQNDKYNKFKANRSAKFKRIEDTYRKGLINETE